MAFLEQHVIILVMFFTRSSLAMEKTMGFNRLFNIPMCSSFYSGALKSFSVEPCREIIYLYYKKSEICRDPPDDMGRSPLSGLTLSVPPRGHVARTFIRAPPGQGGHDTLKYHTRAMLYPIWVHCTDH